MELLRPSCGRIKEQQRKVKSLRQKQPSNRAKREPSYVYYIDSEVDLDLYSEASDDTDDKDDKPWNFWELISPKNFKQDYSGDSDDDVENHESNVVDSPDSQWSRSLTLKVGTAIFSMVIILCIIIGVSVNAANKQSFCQDLKNDSKLDGLDLQTCEDVNCEFDIASCALPCPFGYTLADDGCPNSCICATDSDAFEGDLEFTESDVKNMLMDYGMLEDEPATSAQNSILWNTRRVGNRYKVPYVLDSSYSPSYQNMIKEGLQLISEKTCIDFVSRTTEREYLKYTNTYARCSSWIGRLPPDRMTNGQEIKLREGRCFPRGVAAHETMHALGFHHEQSRPDRDQYVKVMFNNIKSAAYNNFLKLQSGSASAKVSTTYDSRSVMHYSGYAFAINRNYPTLVRVDTGMPPIKQRVMVTQLDADGINQLYNCPRTSSGQPAGPGRPGFNPTQVPDTLQWSQWGSWQGCAGGEVSCWLGGIGLRRRDCIGGTLQKCRERFLGEEYAEFTTCTVSSVSVCDEQQESWTNWGAWNRCSRTCGGGLALRFRDPTSSDSFCTDRRSEAQPCNVQSCSGADANPVWSSWEEVTKCSRTCGQSGFQSRRRFCVHPRGDRAAGCAGDGFETSRCQLPSCTYFDQADDESGGITEVFSANPIVLPSPLCRAGGANSGGWIFGDFDGDNVVDAACLQIASGAPTNYEFLFLNPDLSVKSSRNNWAFYGTCYESKAPIFTADYNDDGVDEVVCEGKDLASVNLLDTNSPGGVRFSYKAGCSSAYGDKLVAPIVLGRNGGSNWLFLCLLNGHGFEPAIIRVPSP